MTAWINDCRTCRRLMTAAPAVQAFRDVKESPALIGFWVIQRSGAF